MKLSSLLFSAALPILLVAQLAGAPALPALAFVSTALVLVLAFDDYRKPARGYRVSIRRPALVRGTRARLPLAA